ncbi:MAG: diguanylate cyclase [Lachnospiraceae bacterium]|nr:diguanylate cyclase [Lachnospiraceae bacterium]
MNNSVDLNTTQSMPDINVPNFKEIINYLKCGALIINSSSSLTFEYANEYFYDLVGYSQDEYQKLFNNSISPRIYEDDVQRLRAAISRQLSMGGNSIKYEFRILKKDGSVAWVMLQGRKSTTDFQKIYASLVDITELKDLYNTVAEKNLELDTLYNNMVGGIIKLSAMDFRVVSANDGFYKMIGYTKEEFLHKFNNIFSDIVYRKDLDKLHDFGTGNSHDHNLTIRILTKTEEKCWFYINASRIDSNDDNPIYLCTITDITDNKTYEKNLEVEQKKRNLLAQVSGEIVWEYEYKTKAFTKGHTHIRSLSNQEQKDDMKKNFRSNLVELSLIHPDDIKSFYKFCDDIDNGKQFVEMDIRVKPNSENFYSWFRSVGQTIYDKNGNPVSIVGKTYNTDDTHDALNALKTSASRDSLTKLYNKASLERKIQNKLNTKSLKAPYAFILADINEFKKINDSYGHLYGDSVIQEIANIFENVCPSNLIGRIGTDVFGIVIEDIDSPDFISTLMDSISFEFTKVFNKQKNSPHVICNFGINYNKELDENYEIMFRKADVALYTAKTNHDKNYVFFDSSLGYNSADYCSLNEYNVSESFSLLQASMDTALITTAIDLLFDSKDLKGSISILLDKINEHFNSEYTQLVCIEPKNGETYHIKSICLPDSHNINYDTISKHYYEQHLSLFNNDKVLYCSDVNKLKDISQKVHSKLSDNGVKSVLQCADINDNKFVGYLCLGTCTDTRTWTTNQVRTFSILSKIIFTALDKLRLD